MQNLLMTKKLDGAVDSLIQPEKTRLGWYIAAT